MLGGLQLALVDIINSKHRGKRAGEYESRLPDLGVTDGQESIPTTASGPTGSRTPHSVKFDLNE